MWSGSVPRYAPFRITETGMTLGRERADASDDQISPGHAFVDVRAAKLYVRDLWSPSGTWVNGRRIDDTGSDVTLPAIVRTGHTITFLVGDVRPFETVTLARRGSLVVGASLAPACRIVDRAAHAEENIGLFGPIGVGRALAQSYAETIGGPPVTVELGVATLVTFADAIAGSRPRTIVLVLQRPLTLPDQPELEAWLETDVRIATVASDDDCFQFMPKQLAKRLSPYGVVLPTLRLDELPETIADRVRARVPGAAVHATLIESVLLEAREASEDRVLRALDDAIEQSRARGAQVLSGQAFEDHLDARDALQICYQGQPILDRRSRRVH